MLHCRPLFPAQGLAVVLFVYGLTVYGARGGTVFIVRSLSSHDNSKTGSG